MRLNPPSATVDAVREMFKIVSQEIVGKMCYLEIQN